MLRTQKDLAAFEQIILEAHERCPLRILSYCLMGNHWHFVVWPKKDGELTDFFRWLAHTHAMRWRVSHNNVGYGHLYQGRYKSFPVQPESLRKVCRYVERNALTAGEVERAEDWRWSSLWVRENGTAEQKAVLAPWPTRKPPKDWAERVNAEITRKEQERWELSLGRSQPFGDNGWTALVAKKLGLEHTIRSEGGGHGAKKGDEM